MSAASVLRVTPIVLEDDVVRLEPLTLAHAGALFENGRDESIWRYMPVRPPQSEADVAAWIGAALEQQAKGAEQPFAILERAGGRAVGSTRYLDIRASIRALEIGWTWLAPVAQRSAVNTRAKRLLLTHAFEQLDALRVQLKTDARNERSQRAIERIGATREGVLRCYGINGDGYVRDAVMYSVVAREWPDVKRRLEALIGAQPDSGKSSGESIARGSR